ncbi:hypothetical protein L9F63_005562, partial [Diploptera punctata]
MRFSNLFNWVPNYFTSIPNACFSLSIMTVTKEENGTNDVAVRQKTVWRNVIILTIIHSFGLYGFMVGLYDAYRWTSLWGFVYGYFGGIGVTAGAHRLWTHRSYKAKLPLRIILMIAFVSSGMNSIFDWVRDHRVHHKFSETNADPHNSKRGLFFSHVGWLLQKKHPDVIRRGREVDMSDIVADPVVSFQEKYFRLMQVILSLAVPIAVPCYFWVWSVNSFAHLYGNRPYDKKINPAENLAVSIIAVGEGWHNYHHTFPWDYKTAELGFYGTNFTTGIIDLFALIGWAYDLRQPSKKLIKKVVEQTGDGTHSNWGKIHVGQEVEEEEDENHLTFSPPFSTSVPTQAQVVVD